MMMFDFSALPSVTQSVIILTTVVVTKSIIGHFSADNTMKYFNHYCQRLSDKVNKSSNSNDQQKIAGLIALLITIVPIVVILWLFEDFIAINWLWQFLLLYFAFGDFNLIRLNNKISQKLHINDKKSARNLLDNYSLRDVATLSTMGLSKATIEMQLLKHLQRHIVVACCFLIVGPIMAFAYRLILEMHYSWNIKLTKFHYFGQTSNLILQLISWLPIRIYYLAYLATTIGNGFISHFLLTKVYFFQLNTNIIIALHAFRLHIKLGGVAIYDHKKIRRSSFNDIGKAPEITDIVSANKQLILVNIILVMSILIIATINYLPLFNR
ncbi:cobalamin biosynthesis protein CobD/CbiB [Thalassotalea profundi]|uniref:Cobalamin biosynthesis protein CbiB n=1 Tax=Thalassotalea profundi TaxID=2036687 RepID=A0ABQ3IY28_9GAMM|nr:cobalamin biosynthesis protein [Thalassotalea profundi]GHE93421.1 hypothetical protein GCM10011501_23500 [Thalassotalea profundi]